LNNLTHPPAYSHLVERLNRFPQGAPESDSLYAILQVLFREEEAGLVAQIPIKPFTAKEAARIWKMPFEQARRVLEGLADRALLLDVEREGQMVYTLPPPMAGFFEFSLMRLRDDVDQKALSELYYQYVTVEDDFMRALLAGGETQVGRIFVHEPVLPEVQVLDYERASEVMRSASTRGISLCYCRFKAQQVGHVCDAPLDICMTFNGCADSLVRHGFARAVDVSEGLDLLQKAYAHNLVQFGENVRQEVGFICNCCGCCCEALVGARRFSQWRPIHTSNFLPVVAEELCTGCGKCADVCPVEAVGLVSANDPQKPHRKKARLDEDICLGCGVCVRNCPAKALRLQARPERVLTPLNTVHRLVWMAIERGQLQDLLFDQRMLWSQRALAAFLGAVLRLPPIQRTLASRQVKSRYLESLLARVKV
jgi:ferredoxin